MRGVYPKNLVTREVQMFSNSTIQIAICSQKNNQCLSITSNSITHNKSISLRSPSK